MLVKTVISTTLVPFDIEVDLGSDNLISFFRFFVSIELRLFVHLVSVPGVEVNSKFQVDVLPEVVNGRVFDS